MSDSLNFYFDQLVTDSDLDQIYIDLNKVERTNLALHHGLATQLTFEDPGPTAFGGIVSGCVVTRNTDHTVNVTAGVVRDQLGRHISVPACVVSLTRQGVTPAGASTAITAVGNGAVIAIGAGQEAWLALAVAYDEILSDRHQDGNGADVDFRILESFHFVLTLGAASSRPNTNVAALQDTCVHLDDILLNDTEEIRSIDPGGGARYLICGTDINFDYFNGGGATDAYDTMLGRRANWLSLCNSDLALSVLYNWPAQYRTAREAIYGLAKQLQNVTPIGASPAGSSLVGTPAYTGALAAPAEAARDMLGVSLTEQLVSLLTGINGKLSRGGGKIVPPTGAYDGLDLDPTGMAVSHTRYLERKQAHVVGAVAPIFLRKPHGHIAQPCVFHDPFCYVGEGAEGYLHTQHQGFPWGVTLSAGSLGSPSAVSTVFGKTGGWVQISIENFTGRYIQLISGYNAAAAAFAGWFDLTSVIATFRFQVPSTLTDRSIFMGLVRNGDLGNPHAVVYMGNTLALSAAVKNAGAAGTGVVGEMTLDAISTVRMWTHSASQVMFQLDNGTPVAVAAASGNLVSTGYDLVIGVTSVNGAAGTINIDDVYASAGSLAADQL